MLIQWFIEKGMGIIVIVQKLFQKVQCLTCEYSVNKWNILDVIFQTVFGTDELAIALKVEEGQNSSGCLCWD